MLALLATGFKLPRDLLFASATGRRWRDRRGGNVPPAILKAWTELLCSLSRRLEQLDLAPGIVPERTLKAPAHAH